MTRALLLACLMLVVGCGDRPSSTEPPPTPNRAPQAQGSIQPQELQQDADTTLNVGSYFSDPDGDQLTYSATSQPGNVVAVTTSGSVVTILGIDVGTGTVTVTARDPGGLNATQSFNVTVVGLSAVLVTLYNATNGPNWSNSNNWLTDAPLEEWYGVFMDASGRVSGLNLSDNNLTGQIPPELGNLTNLDSLDLGFNELSGRIPPELGNLTNLRFLHLGFNELSGQIPPELGNLTNLRWLELGSNELSGQIPPELGSLSNLEYLYLWFNELSGRIPPELGNLTNLRFLRLGFNELSGQIPPELGNLTDLVSLHLESNELSGQIPPELGNLTNLRWLDLGSNELSGQIPPELGSLSNLEELELGSNELSGQIPLELANLGSLEVFDYQDTSLCVPNDNSFRTWLNSLREHRGTGLDCQGTGAGLIFRDDFNSATADLPPWGELLSEIRMLSLESHDPEVSRKPSIFDWIEVTGTPSSSSANADRNSRPRLAQPDFLRDLQAVQEVPRAVCLTRKCP